MLKCLQSQCHTAQFGSALHHTIALCSDYFSSFPEVIPPLIRHQGLRKRASSNSVQMSARPHSSVRPISTMASGSRAHSVKRRSVNASATINWIRSFQSGAYISNTTPRRLSSGGTSKGIPILISKAAFVHTSFTTPPLAEIRIANSKTIVPFSKSYDESVALSVTCSSISMASRTFRSLTFSGVFLNRTGTRTALCTLHTATGTGHPARDCEGYSGTRRTSNLAGTGPSQSRLPVSAMGTMSNTFAACSSVTIFQPSIPTRHSSGYHNSRSASNMMSTHPMTAFPSMGLLPPYYNATGSHNSHSGGGTTIVSSNVCDTGLNT